MYFNDSPFLYSLKVNHIVARPKRGRPSHILPVQTFWHISNSYNVVRNPVQSANSGIGPFASWVLNLTQSIHKKVVTPNGKSVDIWEDLPWWLSHQKIQNISPSLCPHLGLFNNIWSLLVISSEPIGRSQSKYEKNDKKKNFAFNQQ